MLLPDELSYADGAMVACGFGTVYEALEKIGVSGNDAVLVTGLGPVGLAACMLSKALGATKVIGIDAVDERLQVPGTGHRTRAGEGASSLSANCTLFSPALPPLAASGASPSCSSPLPLSQVARQLGIVDEVLLAGPDNVAQVKALTGGHGVERAVECSAAGPARRVAIQATRKWGRVVFIGEGGSVTFEPSEDLLHEQKSVVGSWVTSIWKMEEVVEKIVRWKIKPAALITHRFSLDKTEDAYKTMAGGKSGKVAVVFDEELP